MIRHWCRSFPLLMVQVAQGWLGPPGWLSLVQLEFLMKQFSLSCPSMLLSGQLLPLQLGLGGQIGRLTLPDEHNRTRLLPVRARRLPHRLLVLPGLLLRQP